MVDENELLPEDLDTLVNDLQQDKPYLLPDSQRADSDLVGKLIHTARSAQLDTDYAARLGQHITRKHRRHSPVHTNIAWPTLQPEWFSWRTVALALSSVTLMMILSISSLLNSQVSPITLTPPISENTFNSISTPLNTIGLPSGTNLPNQAQSQTTQSFAQLRLVQAPVPPHTPLPLLKTLDATSIQH